MSIITGRLAVEQSEGPVTRPPAGPVRGRLLARLLARVTRPRLATYARAYRTRLPVKGRVVASTGAGVALELPPGLPGFVRRGDMSSMTRVDPSALIGQTVEGLVIGLPPERQTIIVSPRHLAVERCRAVLDKPRRVPVRVTGANHGGLLVDVYGLRGFVPRSELPTSQALRHTELVGTERRAYVIRINSQQAILSAFPPRARRRRGVGTRDEEAEEPQVPRTETGGTGQRGPGFSSSSS